MIILTSKQMLTDDFNNYIDLIKTLGIQWHAIFIILINLKNMIVVISWSVW